MNRTRTLALECLLAVSVTMLFILSGSASAAAPVRIGQKVDGTGSLRDLLGNSRPLSDFDGKVLVIAFLGTDCPLANLYVPRLLDLDKAYSGRGVQFLAVYPNRPETLDEIAAHAYDREVPFPALKDIAAELADQLAVTRTPTVCVLDKDHVLRYRGRIDDQFAVASRRAEARHHDLRDAMDAILAGNEPERSEVVADGCLINRQPPIVPKESLTYAEDVAPIVQARCVTCHRPGQIGPMSLTDLADMVAHAETIQEVVEQRRMPPWHADGRVGQFASNRRLADAEVATIVGWYEQGMPAGKALATNADLKNTDATRWTIEPDIVFRMPAQAEIPATGVLPYQYYLVQTKFEEDRWVKAAEALPGNPEVVHHVIVYFCAPGRGTFYDSSQETQILAIGGPGEGLFEAPPGTALRLPKGTELLFEMHYTPNGVATTDLSEVGIVFADGPPERELRMNMFGNEKLEIPPRAPHHAQTASFTFKKDGQIFGLLPHMHWRGKDYRAWVEHADGRTEGLLTVPRYDFNWQTFYRFAKPVSVKAGTTIQSVAHWDNSANNLSNPDPSATVRYGLQTSEEMMYGFLSYVYDEPVQEITAPAKPNLLATVMFNSLDKDKSGLIEPAEIPAKMRKELLEAGMELRTAVTPLAFEALILDVSE